MRRAELGEQEAAKGREPFLWAERGQRLGGGGKNMGQAPFPKSSWRKSGKLETGTGTKLQKGERRKDKGEGLNSSKTINKGSAKAATTARYLVVLWWEGQIPRNRVGSRSFLGHTGKSSSTAGRTFGTDC